MSHGIPKHRQLPDKETKLFKEVLSHYELKQYKKGIKSADQILKKFPNHGETLALKALSMHSALPFPPTVASKEKEKEAEELARLAVRKDMQSHITWHVLGIFAKSRRSWGEASKAYAMARKQDPDNIPVLRDAVALYTHTRNYQEAVDVRHHLLCLRPNIRASWLSLIVAHELAGNVEEAIQVYDQYQTVLIKDPASPQEKELTLMHIVRLCMQAGKFEDAKKRLETGIEEKVVSPRGEASEVMAQVFVELGEKDAAEAAYGKLLDQNADNLGYYRGLLKNRGLDITESLDDASQAEVLKVLEEFATKFPKNAAPRRLALDVATGTAFQKLARAYIVSGLERGIPSLFVDLKGIYRDAGKMSAVGDIVADIVKKLQAEESLHGDDTIPPPTTLLWANYFLALHVSHPLQPSPDHQRALELLDAALEHTPTLPEIYMARAMVLKRAGDYQAAAESMEEARLLDGQDRFLNGKAAKYWLRAGDVRKAEELLAMFTKKDVSATTDLTDMQCLWFLQEEGDAHKRNGALAMALKRYDSLVRVFQEYEDDQYDFHTYCMRRMTFTYYVAMLKYEDQLRVHPAYFKTALSAIDIYVKVADDPSLTVEKLSAEEEAERKKAAKKAQKAEQKARKAAAASGATQNEAPLPDADPRGEVLIKTQTPIDDALKLWAPLETHHPKRVETWLTGYELHVRKQQYMLALRDLRAAAALDTEAPGLVPALAHFRKLVSSAELSAPVRAAIEQVLPTLPSSELANAPTSTPAHILALARAQVAASSSPADIVSTLSLLKTHGPKSIAAMREALTLVAGADRETLRKVFRAALPMAYVFASAEEQKARADKQVKKEETGKADV